MFNVAVNSGDKNGGTQGCFLSWTRYGKDEPCRYIALLRQ